MIEIGTFQKLIVSKRVKHGVYLEDKDGDSVLLPAKYVNNDIQENDEIEVFIYTDSQDRIVATTQKPLINPYEFAFLRCIDSAPFGAFMDWGLDRDLFIPKAEQQIPIIAGKTYLVYLFIDEEDRITGTTHIERCTSNEDFDLPLGTQVDLLVYQFTPMGIKVIVDQSFDGLLYRDQVQTPLNIGDHIVGYISKIRPENKLDVSLHRFGYNKIIDTKEKVIQALKDSGGFLPLHDKSSPDEIKRALHISKKIFKKTIGGLYKEKKLRIEPEGIYLIEFKNKSTKEY